jgi:transketolase
VELLVALYFRVARLWPERAEAPERDRIILSKGHAATALYSCLSLRGFFPRDLIKDYGQDGSRLGHHPVKGSLPGIEVSTGSLGHGLGLGSGMALAARMDATGSRVFVIMSDGECNEGSVWESALWAPKHGLGNLTVAIDFNKLQATAPSTELTQLEPLREKWEAFGWEAVEVDGHDLDAVVAAFESSSDSRPKVIVAHTIKGKGVSFMEGSLNWHYRPPSADDVSRALAELE